MSQKITIASIPHQKRVSTTSLPTSNGEVEQALAHKSKINLTPGSTVIEIEVSDLELAKKIIKKNLLEGNKSISIKVGDKILKKIQYLQHFNICNIDGEDVKLDELDRKLPLIIQIDRKPISGKSVGETYNRDDLLELCGTGHDYREVNIKSQKVVELIKTNGVHQDRGRSVRKNSTHTIQFNNSSIYTSNSGTYFPQIGVLESPIGGKLLLSNDKDTILKWLKQVEEELK